LGICEGGDIRSREIDEMKEEYSQVKKRLGLIRGKEIVVKEAGYIKTFWHRFALI